MTDITLAIDQASLGSALGALIEIFQFEFAKSTQGALRFGIEVACHLERGHLTLQPPDPASLIYKGGFFNLTDIVVAWDKLELTATVHIPRVGWGDTCIVPSPWGCILEIPGASFFDTDVSGTVAIDSIVRSRVDIGVAPLAQHIVNGVQKQWLVVPHVVWSNIQPLDFADTIADVINGLVTNLVNDALSFLPGWAVDIVDAILNGISNCIRGLLGLGANIQDWLSTVLRVSLDPFDEIFTLLEDHFEQKLSLYSVSDPMQILAQETTPFALPAVLLPVSSIDLLVYSSEFVIEVTS